jgi:hypothetical protein
MKVSYLFFQTMTPQRSRLQENLEEREKNGEI